MDPIVSIIAALSSNVFGDLSSTYYKQFLRLFLDRYSTAQEQYQNKGPNTEKLPLERRRQEVLAELNQLQNQVILSVSDNRFLTRILPMLLDQTLQAFEAQAEQSLNVVTVNLGQIKGYVEQHRKMMRQRATARWAAVIVSFAAFLILGGIAYWGTLPGGPRIDTILPVFQLPLPILLWSVIGSLTAMLYRFNNSGDIELQDPLRWLFTRPLTGIVMGTITYLVIKIGLLGVSLPKEIAVGSTELFSLIAFLSGFSDRFADGLLKSLVGRFGGDVKGDLVNVNNISSSVSQSDSALLMEALSEFGESVKQRGRSARDTIIHKNQTQGRVTALPTTDDAEQGDVIAPDFKVADTKSIE